MKKLLWLLVLTGCATEYQSHGLTGGYRDWSRGPGRHHIEVDGNAYTNASTLREHFNRRAMELCTAEGYQSYEGEPQMEADARTKPAEYRSETSRDMNGHVQTVTRSDGPTTVTRFTAVGEVTCTPVRSAPPPPS